MVRFGARDDGKKTLIGMVHLQRVLDGGPPIEAVEALAIADARALAEAGFDAVVIENFGDRPFFPDRVPAHTVAGMARIADAVRRTIAPWGTKLGINVLRNDVQSALAIAAATGAEFVRVNVHIGAYLTDQGIVQGQAHASIRYRDRVAPGCSVFADVRVKHAAPLAERPLAEEAVECFERGRADALIVSGAHTGGATDPGRLEVIRRALPDAPLFVGSGATPEQLPGLSPFATGYIVGTWLKEDGQLSRPVDAERCRAFVAAAR